MSKVKEQAVMTELYMHCSHHVHVHMLHVHATQDLFQDFAQEGANTYYSNKI